MKSIKFNYATDVAFGVLVAIAIILALSSCKKEYTCTCDMTRYSFNSKTQQSKFESYKSVPVNKFKSTDKKIDRFCHKNESLYDNGSYRIKTTFSECVVK